MRPKFLMLLAVCATCLSLPATSAAQRDSAKRPAPVITRSLPSIIAPGMSIDLEGYRLDDFPADLSAVQVLFIQGDEKSISGVVGREGSEGSELQTINLVVPAKLIPGSCQIVVKAGERESGPLVVEVASFPPAPIVTSEQPKIAGIVRARLAQPGDVIVVEGTNFSGTDQVEIVDAKGQIHFAATTTGSSAASLAFTIPDDVADGEATFAVVEQRSGIRQRSKQLSLGVLNVPIPLEFSANWLKPVAPSQWLDLCPIIQVPLRGAEAVEVVFVQHGQVATVKLAVKRWTDMVRPQVPEILVPGEVSIKTRVWRDGSASDWSEPIVLRLLAESSPRVSVP